MAETATSTSKTGPTTATRPNRLPAPTLFVGPPSRNGSQLSLSRQVAESSTNKHGASKPSKPRPNDAESSSGALKPPENLPSIQLRRPSDKSLETKWREMRNTLDEVEVIAQSSTHVFSEKHATALDELRRTQVELAKAWGRGSDESAGVAQSEGKASVDAKANVGDGPGQRKRGDTTASAATQASIESEASGTTTKSGRSHLEEDATEDIRLAKERRIANESYFKTVDKNVKDVVTKLEAVAAAMRDVEGESRSLWSGSSSFSQSDATEQAGG